MERVLSFSSQEIEENEDEKEKEVLAMLEAQPQWVRSKPHRWEDLRVPLEAEIKKESETYTKLKQLPENLKHVFLDSEKNCPPIISSMLKEKEEEKLVWVLKKYKIIWYGPLET